MERRIRVLASSYSSRARGHGRRPISAIAGQVTMKDCWIDVGLTVLKMELQVWLHPKDTESILNRLEQLH